MAFEVGRRRGKLWEDTRLLATIMEKEDFNVSGKGERQFEIQISGILKSRQSEFKHPIQSQYHNDTKVASAYFFGKKHRPDLSIDEFGTAVELKFIGKDLQDLNGVKTAIGQAMIYRLRYKFAVNVLVMSSAHKNLYEDAYKEHESDLHRVLRMMADEHNIFTIIRPAFKPHQGIAHSISFMPLAEQL
jgi:hypothetical protein